MKKLQFWIQKQKLFEYKLLSKRIKIGRSDKCDISLVGNGISREHCILEQRQDGWRIVDTSKHGVFVDDEKITVKNLLAGASFFIGEYEVRLCEQYNEVSETIEDIIAKEYELSHVDLENQKVERVVLSYLEQGQKRQKQLRHHKTTIGGKGSQISIADSKLTREHAVLFVSQGRLMIMPKNGSVYLNSRRIYMMTPVNIGETFQLGKTIIQVKRQELEKQISNSFGKMVGESSLMQEQFRRLQMFATHDFSILICGESGTGKELAAQGIHQSSSRKHQPFVAINCGAIPENLIESVLFGHKKGAFSGAISDQKGAFLEAEGGTLFLDELGELSLSAQVKLLRVLETGEFRPIGSDSVSHCNVRIVAATNQNLRKMISEGRFRQDLLFRLEVLSVSLPPLRDRLVDIPIIARYLSQELGNKEPLASEVLSVLQKYSWPGNIRELRNVLTRAFVLGQGHIRVENLIFHSLQNNIVSAIPQKQNIGKDTHFLVDLFHKHKGNQSAMARELGLPRTTLIYRLQQLGLI